MTRFLITSVSAIALLGLAACSDADDTTTQSVSPDTQQSAPATDQTKDNMAAPSGTDTTTPAAPADNGSTAQ